MEDVMDALQREGQPVELDCPYRELVDSGWRPPMGLEVFRRVSETRLPSLAAVTDALRGGLAPVLGLEIPGPFFSPVPPWIIPADPNDVKGLHAVVGVGLGLNADEPLVLVRNSWGDEWGNRGYAWLGSEFLEAHLLEIVLLRGRVVRDR